MMRCGSRGVESARRLPLDTAPRKAQNAPRRLVMVGFVLLAALFAAQGSPEPQVSASRSSSDIVVEGVRQRRERVRQFIKALDDVPNFGQIGKFHSPVCPAVMGLPEAQNRLVAERMKRVAQAAGIRVGDSKCAPNVFFIASVDKG